MPLAAFIASLHALAAVVSWTFAVIVLRSGPTQVSGRRLCFLLALEGTIQALFLGNGLLANDSKARGLMGLVILIMTGLLVWTYLALLRDLKTPLVVPLRRRGLLIWAGMTVLALSIAPSVGFLFAMAKGAATSTALQGPLALLPTLLLLLLTMIVSVFGLLAAISAWRRSSPGGAARAQARAFALAFGTRDVLVLVLLVFPGDASVSSPSVMGYAALLALPLMTLLYVPILAYGILRTRLFDLDLKLKSGIRRSTMATVMLVVVFGAGKTAEAYLNRTFGLIAGGVAAGAMLVLVPRLSRIGDKVANAALPNADPTPAYLSFKKLEVYKAAVESAMGSDGEIHAAERAMLARLQARLGVAAADASAVEAEINKDVRLHL